jgi:hypothetical protein
MALQLTVYPYEAFCGKKLSGMAPFADGHARSKLTKCPALVCDAENINPRASATKGIDNAYAFG